ncbi:MAG: mRNA surveillance protein pelota [Thermoplasmata archaeon]
MRLIHQDPASGLLKLRLETPSDLWRAARIIHPGELVGASTTRRDPDAPEDSPAAQRSRRRVWLVIRAEQVEFHGFSHHLRVTGPIVEGPFDIGRHHTLDLEEGSELSIQKEDLLPSDRTLLEEGTRAKGEPRLVVAAVDWGESSIVRLRGRVVEPVADVRRSLAGKRFKGGQAEKDRADYVEELLDLVRRELPDAHTLVIAGPGFLKEELARRLTEKDAAARKKVRVYPTAESGRVGIDELLRSGRAAEALAGSVAAEEADLVERLVTALGGGTRAAVGMQEVRDALDIGAVETMLVAEEMLTETSIIPLLERAREARARVFVVRGDAEPGAKLRALGHIGAILRFDWAPAAGRGGRATPPTGSPGPLREGPRSGA